ncbi:hypothetical protein BC828DRAFT_402912, partial [Blastocladiella britannica]
SSIAVPLIAISKLQLSPPEASEWFHSGLKVGTHLPGVVSKGTWYGVHGGKAFFFFYSVPTNAAEADATTARVLGIEFTEGSGDQEPGMDQYRKLVIEVPAGSTAGEWKRKIEEARRMALASAAQ